jgi:hypothetical protein
MHSGSMASPLEWGNLQGTLTVFLPLIQAFLIPKGGT